MDLSTILGSKLATSVTVNSLLVPANSLSSHLQRFTDPALFNHLEFEKFGLSKSGSLVRIRLGSRYFAVTSFHQVRNPGYKFDQLCLMSADHKSLLTSHQATFPTGTDDQNEDLDCVIFEYTDVVNAGKLPRSGWYDIAADIGRVEAPEPVVLCCIGYPGYRNNIDYDANAYPISPNAVWGYQVAPSVQGRLSFEPKPEISFSPEGMSGAPVFGLTLNSSGNAVFLAGILTNASSVRFNFVSLLRIKSMILSS